MANILLEYLRRIDERCYVTGREHRQFLGELKKALNEIWKIRKITSKEALECLENLGGIEISHTESDRDEDSNGDWVYDTITVNDGSVKELYYKDFNNIKQYILKAQKLEEENARYKHLEEQLYCPLETYIKLHNTAYIYDVDRNSLKVLQVLADTVVVKDPQGEKKFLFLTQYKKTWWLKENHEE